MDDTDNERTENLRPSTGLLRRASGLHIPVMWIGRPAADRDKIAREVEDIAGLVPNASEISNTVLQCDLASSDLL